MIRVPTDKETGEPTDKWPPSFKFKVNRRNGDITSNIFDENKNKMNVNDPEGEDYVPVDSLLKKNSKVKMIMKCNGIWIASGKFGCTWSAEQMQVTAPAGFDDFAFNSDDDSDDEDSPEERVTLEDNAIESSDDDDSKEDSEEDGESEEDEVEEEVKPKKKVVRKKKN